MKAWFCAVSIASLFVASCTENHQFEQTVPDLTGQTCPALIGVWPVWDFENLPHPDTVDALSHLVIAFALPQANGDLDTSYVDATLQRLAPRIDGADIKLVLSIGGAVGYGDAFIKLSHDTKARARFVKTVSSYVEERGFSGVDIDWEVWTRQAVEGLAGNDPVESALLLTLIRDLRAALPSDVTLSTDIFAGSYYGPQYRPELAKHADWVNLMAFDFTGQWEGSNIGHHADLATFKLAIDDVVARGFPIGDLVLGIPAYGVRFEDGRTQKVVKMPNKTIAQMHAQSSDSDASIDPNRGEFEHTFYETPELAAAKTRLGLHKGVAGFFLFDLSQDPADEEWSILQAIDRTIKASKCDQIANPLQPAHRAERPRPHSDARTARRGGAVQGH